MDKYIQELKRNKNVVAAYLFGSHGTHKQTPLSDVDVCVFTKDINKDIILELSSFGSEKIDLSIFDELPTYIKPEVFKGKPFFIKDKMFIAKKFAVSFRQYQDFKKYQQSYWKALKRKIKNEKN
ncbi:MAG: nucleotidyltransferase domain-containing protein [Nanoarchaeota archaeon]|nr:nucleotidyltransferase domain-containing protein [Nanoarchaeota archaeon]MBU1632734.1 nucleotidyltransferase domain-containing protein [Nanoarchaeota archaeon]MBU1875974.1 nucleotidyltransferase domain-containing protein [Nanoarchaeota archaeon]